jgi:hypothetical protein
MTAGFLVKAGIGLAGLAVCLFLVRRLLARFWTDYERFSHRETDWSEGMNPGPAAAPPAPDRKTPDLLRSGR